EKKKLEKEEEKLKKLEQYKKDEELKKTNPEEWLKIMKERRAEIEEKIKKKKRLRDELKDRKSSASKNRLRAMATAANPDLNDENFGWQDEDWDVYKVFSKEFESDSEDDETKLVDIDKQIMQVELQNGKNIETDYYNRLFNRDNLFLSEQGKEQLLLTVERIRVPEILFQP